jgi:hypothetical protein
MAPRRIAGDGHVRAVPADRRPGPDLAVVGDSNDRGAGTLGSGRRDRRGLPDGSGRIANTREARSPNGSTFSMKMTVAITALQARLITPTAKRITNNPKQHPTQYEPWTIPRWTAPPRWFAG